MVDLCSSIDISPDEPNLFLIALTLLLEQIIIMDLAFQINYSIKLRLELVAKYLIRDRKL